MNISKKNQSDLKSRFKKNFIPTEDDFADLIDAGLNQKGDGIAKSQGEPLSIEASTDATNKVSLQLFHSFATDTSPLWTVGLKAADLGIDGFAITDGSAHKTRLLIDGTGALTATGVVNATGAVNATGVINANGGINVPASQQLTAAGNATVTGTLTTGINLITPKITSPNTSPVVLNSPVSVTGILTANSDLSVTGTFTANKGATIGGGTLNVNSLLSATQGISVGSGQLLNLLGPGNASISNNSGNLVAQAVGSIVLSGNGVTATTALTTSGIIFANGGVALNNSGGWLTVAGALQAGPSSSGLGTLNAVAPIVAQNGITVYPYKHLSLGNASCLFTPWAGNGTWSNYGVRFDKMASQYVTLPTIPASANFSSGFTMRASVYVSAFDEYARIMELGNGPNSDNILFYLHSDGSFAVTVYRGSANNQLEVRSPPGSVLPGVWQHLMVTVDSAGNAKLYRNNSIVLASGTVMVPNNVQRSVNYLAKSSWNDPYLSGYLAEVSLFVGPTFNLSGVLGSEPGLLGYWKMGDLGLPAPVDSCTTANRLGNATLNGAIFVPSFNFSMEWSTPGTLANGWTAVGGNYNSFGYFRDPNGFVHLRGSVKNAVNSDGVKNIFQLPIGYCPPGAEQLGALGNLNTTPTAARVIVYTDGTIVPSPGFTFLSLDGITFRALT